MFAEFLLFLLVFPCGHASVGLTVIFGRSSGYLLVAHYPLCLGPVNVRWIVRSDVCACEERGVSLLLLILA